MTTSFEGNEHAVKPLVVSETQDENRQATHVSFTEKDKFYAVIFARVKTMSIYKQRVCRTK